ncbi:MAG: FMN-binding negative transcriptional regulator [Verrucomicrobia bacterium]|nr:FMN-binding negative transcriptional regulator [Verrucomicrobiota bacterium]
MYIPETFVETDARRIAAVIREHSFATVVTFAEGRPFASHLPLLFRPDRGGHGVLIGHMARANSQWRHFQPDTEVLAIFTGPHGYISPSWYANHPAVPTWNYVAIHTYGQARLIEGEQELDEVLRATVNFYESGQPVPWQDTLPADFKAGLKKAIVGFEIEITRLEAKFKLGQNRKPEDITGAIAALARSENQTDRELAALMKSQYEERQRS